MEVVINTIRTVLLLPIAIPFIVINSIGMTIHNVNTMNIINEKKRNPNIFETDGKLWIYDNKPKYGITHIYAHDSTCVGTNRKPVKNS